MMKKRNISIIRSFSIFLCISSILLFAACGEKVKPSRVDLEQVETDGSTNDRYLFRDELQKERERKKRTRKKENF